MQDIPYKGFLLGIEGPDVVSKATLCSWLKEWFSGLAVTHVFPHDSSDTPEAEILLERILIDRDPDLHESLPPLGKMLMLMADRVIHLEKTIWPKLNEGHLVITDQFWESTFAHQSQEGVDFGKLRVMHDTVFDGYKPDLTIVLDGDPTVFRARVSGLSQESLNHYDHKPLSFHQQYRTFYTACAAADPGRYLVVDAEQSFEQVLDQIIPSLLLIHEHLNKHPPAETQWRCGYTIEGRRGYR